MVCTGIDMASGKHLGMMNNTVSMAMNMMVDRPGGAIHSVRWRGRPTVLSNNRLHAPFWMGVASLRWRDASMSCGWTGNRTG